MRKVAEREIKFRVWDDKLGKMLNCDDHPIVFHGENGWEVYGDVAWTDTDYDLIQYTGLKDKTGKEIYEGDIVKWCLPKGYRVTMSPEDDPLAFIFGVALGEISEDSTFIDAVEYRDGSFYLMCKDTGGGALLSKHNDKAEIIGNIYESPELVK